MTDRSATLVEPQEVEDGVEEAPAPTRLRGHAAKIQRAHMALKREDKLPRKLHVAG